MLIQTGSKIPDNQLCLTFDDGPGPHTADISAYLRDQCIVATFFLIGEFIPTNEHIVRQLIDDGHEVGNHTYSHPSLTECSQSAGVEIVAAHEELRPFVAGRDKQLFFRPPFGYWPTIPDLNDVTTTRGERLGDLYSGPISWDFSGDDWWYWEKATSKDDAHALLSALNRYARARRGIVLLHDHSQKTAIASQSQTFRMIRGLVPMWRRQGCLFLSLQDAYRAGYVDVGM